MVSRLWLGRCCSTTCLSGRERAATRRGCTLHGSRKTVYSGPLHAAHQNGCMRTSCCYLDEVSVLVLTIFRLQELDSSDSRS